jgi:hypothetical protein
VHSCEIGKHINRIENEVDTHTKQKKNKNKTKTPLANLQAGY